MKTFVIDRLQETKNVNYLKPAMSDYVRRKKELIFAFSVGIPM